MLPGRCAAPCGDAGGGTSKNPTECQRSRSGDICMVSHLRKYNHRMGELVNLARSRENKVHVIYFLNLQTQYSHMI